MADANLNWVGPGVVAALEAAGRSVVAPDARGHGASGKPHDPAAYGEGAMARDLGTLVDVIGADAVDLAGYSMGAVVALLAATTDARIRRLVVGGVGCGIVEVGGADTRVIEPGAMVASLECDDPTTIADPRAAGFRLFADAVGADRRALAAQARVIHATPLALDRITAPTLVLAGEIPGARLARLSGDHFGAVVDPRFAGLTVDFLGGREVGA